MASCHVSLEFPAYGCSPRTITMRFRKPTKLGAASESWLRHEGLVCECTAATWRYFFCGVARSFSAVVPFSGSTSVSVWSVPLRRVTEPLAICTLVAVDFIASIGGETCTAGETESLFPSIPKWVLTWWRFPDDDVSPLSNDDAISVDVDDSFRELGSRSWSLRTRRGNSV